MKHLSIIVPIFNVEPYVRRCLQSLEEQDISEDDYEIICINDGSPDNSRSVVMQMQKEYNNILLIDQENQGVSCARNRGIDRASGMYTLFIDPDDYVDAGSFGRILKDAETRKAQVSFLGFTVLNKNGTILQQIFNIENSKEIFLGMETYHLARGDGRTDPDRTWAVLFETDFLNINKLRYLPNVPYLEDGEFIARILCQAERCIFGGYSFYQRTARPGSATNSMLFYSEMTTNGFLLAAGNLKGFQKEQYLNEKQKVFLNQPISKFIFLAINSSLGLTLIKKLVTTIKALKALTLGTIDLEGCDRIYRIYGKVYNLSPYLSAFALFLYPRVKRLFLPDLAGRNF